MKWQVSNKLKSILSRVFLILPVCLVINCSPPKNEAKRLPVFGERVVVQKRQKNKTVLDTVFHQVPRFCLVDQDSQLVTDKTFAHKVYVSDFFFTSCPTICPKMTTQMLRVYEQFKDNSQVKLLSHTLDPQHDSVAILRDYAQRLEVSSEKWHFVTGHRDSIYAIASQYFVSAKGDPKKAAGLVHSGAFVLVDTNRHVRGIYDGTKPEQVDALLFDIQILLAEKNL